MHFVVAEFPRVRGNVGLSASVNEPLATPQGQLQCTLPNTFGRGELLEFDLQYALSGGVSGLGAINPFGVSTTNTGSVARFISFSKPFAHNFRGLGNSEEPNVGDVVRGCNASLSLFHTDQDTPWNRLHVRESGIQANVSFPSIGPLGQLGFTHSLGVSALQRSLLPAHNEPHLDNFTPLAMRELCGKGNKFSILHSLNYSTRSWSLADAILPLKSGFNVGLKQEFSPVSFCGDVSHSKHELVSTLNVGLPLNCSLQLTAATGVLLSQQPQKAVAAQLDLPDHFLLGGPQNLRGFPVGGVGNQKEAKSSDPLSPREVVRCAIGGNAFWFAGAHLFAGIPFAPRALNEHVRLHAFAAVGSNARVDFNEARRKQELQQLVSNYRSSLGAGLAVRVGSVARIELNYVYPVRALPGDVAAPPGIQLGLGIQFW